MLAKQQVQADISRQIGERMYTQFSNDDVRIVLIHNLNSNMKMLAVHSDFTNFIVRLENIFTTEEKSKKAWDALETFNIKRYPLQILHTKGIPKQHNITEEELKKARLA